MAQVEAQADDKNVETQNNTRGEQAGKVGPSSNSAMRVHAMKIRRPRGKDQRQPATFSNQFRLS